MRKTAFILAAIILVLTVLLPSCSGSESANAVAFSETLDGEEARIWYECQNKIETKESGDTYSLEEIMGEEPESAGSVQFGRETRVVWVKVYKGGKLTSYSCTKNVYLGHFAKMTDEEIISELEEDRDTYIKGQDAQDYEIYLYSDATGHELVYEGIPSVIKQGAKKDPMYFMTLISKDSVPAFPVYDSFYAGYMLYNYDETPFGEACLITRCEDGTVFGLDSLDLEGAIVDYATPEDMLHEKNAELSKQLKRNTETTEEERSDNADGDADAATEEGPDNEAATEGDTQQ